MTTKSAFDTSDHVSLKGQVKGVTRISKKVKVLFFVGAVLLLGFIVFSIFSIDNSDEVSAADKMAATPEGEKPQGRPEEPAKGDIVTKGIGNGNSATIAAPPSFTIRDGVSVPGESPGTDSAGIVVPGGAPTSNARAAAGPAAAGSASKAAPGVIVPSASGVIVPAAGGVPAVSVPPPLTPAQLAAQNLAEARSAQRKAAMSGGVEVSGGSWDAGSKGGAGVPGAGGSPFLASMQGAGGAPNAAALTAPRAQEQDDQNKQGRKEAFLREAEAKTGQFYLKDTRQAPLSKYELKMGWKIPAFLIDGIDSDLPGQACAQVRENVYDSATGKYLLIPQGAKICGNYDSQVAVGQKRILFAWARIMFDDSSTLNLGGMPGADQAGYAGFEAEVDNHYLKVFTSAAMLSVISAGVQISQPQQATGNGAPSVGQTAAGALGQQIGQVSSGLIQRDLKIQPTLRQAPGYRFNIQITRDIVFPGPYKRS